MHFSRTGSSTVSGVAEPISEGDVEEPDVEEADSEDKPVEEYKRILKIDSQDLYICTWLGKKSQNSLHLPVHIYVDCDMWKDSYYGSVLIRLTLNIWHFEC